MKQRILKELKRYVYEQEDFKIQAEYAMDASLVGLPMYGEPILGVCDAEDPWFSEFQKEGVIGPHHLLPKDWLPDAKCVISVFLPKSQAVRASNRNGNWPSQAWLHARHEGQFAINRMATFLCKILEQQGYTAVAPSIDARFKAGTEKTRFTSNWSERHAAYACNLGTFSLSKGLITEKGVAGRFLSVITNASLPVDARQQREKEEACSHCGACIMACPAHAITMESGKDHVKCSAFLDLVREKEAPRYGCGKCQTGMPCEFAMPIAKRTSN